MVVNEPGSIHGVVDHLTVVVAAVVDELDLIAQRTRYELGHRSPGIGPFVDIPKVQWDLENRANNPNQVALGQYFYDHDSCIRELEFIKID